MLLLHRNRLPRAYGAVVITVHTYNDTRTRDNTLALYGVKHRSLAYLALRGLARTALVLAVFILPHALVFALVP